VGIPAVFTAQLNSLLLAFLKEFVAEDPAKEAAARPEIFPGPLYSKASTGLPRVRSSFMNEYYDIVKNLPELRRFFATFF
jgi:hypothetical protein